MVPAEHVHMAIVDLPLPSARKRLAAAPFAMEEMLAERIEDVHIAVGPPVSGNRYPVAAVSRSRMAGWIAALDAAGLGQARLVPDALTLPPTPDGWTVGGVGRRALVRREDATAFACDSAMLSPLWQAAGKPTVRAFGDGLPDDVIVAERIARPGTPALDGAVFDLRQGIYAPGGEKASHGWLRAAVMALAAGGIAHAAIDIADARVVQERAAETREEARAMLARVAPDMQGSADPVSALARMAPEAEIQRQPGFLDLFAKASSALDGAPMAVAVTALAYSTADAALTLDLEIADLPALQKIGEALAGSGLAVRTGSADTANGATTARIVIRESGR